MIRAKKATVLTLAEKCKNILASNWQGHLHTIKADAKGSKEDIYTSKVKYIVKKGRPFIWVQDKDMHNMNTIIDERSSFSVASPFPGPLAKLLKLTDKLPARIALTGDILPLREEKAQLTVENLKEIIEAEERVVNDAAYTVSSILSCSDVITASRSDSLKELLDEHEKYHIYKFIVSSCMYVDGNGGTHEVDTEDIEKCRTDPLASFSSRLIDGINQSEARCKALTLFCLVHLNANARDVYMLSVDRKGFDMLAKVAAVGNDGICDYQWKEYRFSFKEEAFDLETFCGQLVEMEEEVVKKIGNYSGLT
ncbi:unnamed protein product [Linum trigynum]|uniref:DUF2470 domain-containing protein n=1 Tax=Linum trigynum TaxID=586398 RepID=A0AAV2DNA0_9ROSI